MKIDNACVDCLKCGGLKDCCNGSFEGTYRKVVSEAEADTYGRQYLSPHPDFKGWYVHEHYGRCPHADARTGLCDIHDIKPAWCKTFPVSFTHDGQIAMEDTCVPFVVSENLDKHIAQVKQLAKLHEPIRIQLQAKAAELLEDARTAGVTSHRGIHGRRLPR